MPIKDYFINILKKLKRTKYLFIIIIIISALIRLLGITWGSSRGTYHPDGAVFPRIAYSIYPGIPGYDLSEEEGWPKFGSVNIIAGNFIFGLFAGTDMLEDMAIRIMIARVINIIYGVLVVVMVYFITKEIFNNKNTALLAAFFMGISRLAIQESHFTTPKSILLFYTALALYLTILGYKKKSMKYLLLASASTGFAAAAQWRFFTIVPIILASFKLKSLKKKIATVFLSLIIIAIIFNYAGLISNPKNTLGVFRVAAVDRDAYPYKGKIGTFFNIYGSGFIFHSLVTIPRAVGYPIFLIGLVLIFRKSNEYIKEFFKNLKNKNFEFNPGLLVIIWLIFEYIAIGYLNVPEERRALSFTIGLVCFASAFFINISKKKKFLLSGVIGYTLIFTLMCEYNYVGENDTRDIAKDWFNANIKGDITYCRNTWYAPGGLNGKALDCGKQETIINGLKNNADYLILAHLWYKRHLEGKMNWTLYLIYKDLFANKTGYRPIKVFRKVTPPTYESIVHYLITDSSLLLPEWVNDEIWIFKRVADTAMIDWTDIDLKAQELEKNYVKPY